MKKKIFLIQTIILLFSTLSLTGVRAQTVSSVIGIISPWNGMTLPGCGTNPVTIPAHGAYLSFNSQITLSSPTTSFVIPIMGINTNGTPNIDHILGITVDGGRSVTLSISPCSNSSVVTFTPPFSTPRQGLKPLNTNPTTVFVTVSSPTPFSIINLQFYTGAGVPSALFGTAKGFPGFIPSAANFPTSCPSAPIVGAITQPTCLVATGSVALSGLPSGSWTVTISPAVGGATGTTGTGITTTIGNLPAGNYTFTVTNAAGCISPPSLSATLNPVTHQLGIPGASLSSVVGISTLNQPEFLDNIPNALLALESKTKGFIITRVANPVTAIADPKEGMIVFDTTANCIKLFRNGVWACITQKCIN